MVRSKREKKRKEIDIHLWWRCYTDNQRLPKNTNLANVADDNFTDKDLAALASPQNGEFVLALDSALQSAELSLLGIIIEGSYQDDDYDGYQNGEALDPFVRLVLLVAYLIC